MEDMQGVLCALINAHHSVAQLLLHPLVPRVMGRQPKQREGRSPEVVSQGVCILSCYCDPTADFHCHAQKEEGFCVVKEKELGGK